MIPAAGACPFIDQGDLCIRGTTSSTACYGDSGGPAVVSVNGNWQLVGATSRAGGRNTSTCGADGVLYTSIPAFRGWIDQYVNAGGNGSQPCTQCTPATATISTGQTKYQPHYYSQAPGTHRAWLSQPAGADFVMGLFYYANSNWSLVAHNSNASGSEPLSYSGPEGYYRWAVYARNGAGSYTIYTQKP